MTRIIGGTAGGRRIKTPPGENTRPTSDRVREAMFSALESTLGTMAGRCVLDLYAGSGALALEAASRGARRATAVESDRRTASLISANAQDLRLPVSVVARAVEKFVAQPANQAYDLVFLDPPYALGEGDLADVVAALVANGWVHAESLMVVERSARSPEPRYSAPWATLRMRRYGETALWYVHVAEEQEDST